MNNRIGALDWMGDHPRLVFCQDYSSHLTTIFPEYPPVNPGTTVDVLLELAAHYQLDQLWIHQSVAVQSDPDWPLHAQINGWSVFEHDATPDPWWVHAYLTKQRDSAVDLVIPANNRLRRRVEGTWTGGGDWEGCFSDLAHAGQLLATVVNLARLGVPVHRGPGSTGKRLMARSRIPSMAVPHTWPPMAGRVAPPLFWRRGLTDEEAGARYLVGLDKHGAYLAATSSVSLGIGSPQLVERPQFSPSIPGYWRVEIPPVSGPIGAWGWLPPLTAGRQYKRQLWLPTPTLNLLASTLFAIDIREAWLWPEHGRLLVPWYQTLRDARSRILRSSVPEAAAVRAALKRIYTSTIGRLAMPDLMGTPLYRPDWRDAIIASSHAALMRQAYRATGAGLPPFAVAEDCLYWATDRGPHELAAIAGLDLGDGLGQYSIKDWVNTSSIPEGMLGGKLQPLQMWLNARRREAVPA